MELENDVENPAAFGRDPDYARSEFGRLTKALRRDGFEYKDGRLVSVGRSQPHLEEVAARYDLPALHRQIDRMTGAVDSDPDLAIGTAKEIVETTCKTILRERNVDVDPGWDVPELVKAVRKALKLLPDDIPDRAKGVQTIRRLLSNLGTVGQGIAELRNLYGTGHGKDGQQRQLPPRLARLAAGSAATLAVFLLETHATRSDEQE